MSWVTAIIEAIIAILLTNLGSFAYIDVTGPYQTGHRDVTLKGETSPKVSIYYPADTEECGKMKTQGYQFPSFCLDGTHNITGLAKGLDNQSNFLYRDMIYYKLKVYDDVSLHKDFADGGKKLTPVILSHGLIGDRTSYVSIAKELASYGCIVYALSHTDGSATYFKDESQSPPKDVYYEHYEKVVHKVRMDQHRSTQVDVRAKDIAQVIDLIKREAKNKVQAIDADKLVAIGHCLGGLTAIEVCHKFKNDFKLCCSLDTYFSGRSEVIKESDDYVIDQPLMLLTAQFYHEDAFLADYDAKGIHSKFYEDTKTNNKSDKNYDLKLENASIWNQRDHSLYLMIWFKILGLVYPPSDVVERYTKTISTVTAFLGEHDMLPIKYGKTVKEVFG